MAPLSSPLSLFGGTASFIQYVLVRYLAGVTQVLPSGGGGGDGGDASDDSGAVLGATDWRVEGIEEEDEEDGSPTKRQALLRVVDGGKVSASLTALVKDVFMIVDSSSDAILNALEVMVSE